jgi:exosortase D (VPLPA-CTERM-specific)
MNMRVNTVQHIWFKVSALFVLFVAAYWIPLKGIVAVWWTDEDYQYGFLIPLISAYLLWDKRAIVRKLRARSSWIVLPVLVFFVLLSLYGILGSSGNISRPAIPILVILFVAFYFGIHVAWKLILPLGFLIFMIPLPSILDRTIGVFLKGVSSKLGGELIRMCGYTVHVSGNIIDLGFTQLQVADACSGLRFLFPLFALGIVYAYFFERVRWKQILCVFATIPIAILTNVFRVGITGILTNKYGPRIAEGFYHGSFGWIIFIVALVFLFLLGRLLWLFPPKGGSLRANVASQPPLKNNSRATGHGSNTAFLVSICLLLMVGLLTWNTKALPPVQLRDGIESFPVDFADWRGRPQVVDPDIIIRSGAEEAFSGLYVNTKNCEVSLYLGYRATAFLENENFFHSPTVCLPAAGWKGKEISTHQIDNVPNFQEITVKKMIMELMGMRQLVYFWFQTKSKATHDKNINRFHLTLHALRKDNTYDLFVRPITPIQPNESIQEAEKRMDQFVRDMMDPLLEFLAEQKVEGS